MKNENPNKRDLNSESRFGEVGLKSQFTPSFAKEDKGGGLDSANARESSKSKSTQMQSKLAHFPIILFASVMGMGGLALAFKKASVAFGTPLYMLFGLFGLILATLAVLFVSYKTLVAMSNGKICAAE